MRTIFFLPFASSAILLLQDHSLCRVYFLSSTEYFFSATFLVTCLYTFTLSFAIHIIRKDSLVPIRNEALLPPEPILSDLMMKADESNDSGLDIANGSLEEARHEPFVVVDGDAESDKGSNSDEQSPIKSDTNQVKSSNGSDKAVSNLSPESQHSFLIAENKHRSRSDTDEKVDQERRSLDQLSPVDFRGLEQHQHVHAAQNYAFLSPSQQDFRPHHGYQQSVIMPPGPSQPYQNHSEWYPNEHLSAQDYTFVGHEGMFVLICNCFQGVTTSPFLIQRVASV